MILTMRIPRIIISSGEPAGIGPDICLALSQHDQACGLVVLADPQLLAERARCLGIDLVINLYSPHQDLQAHQAGQLTVWPIELRSESVCGQLDRRNSPYVLEILNTAVNACLYGPFDGLVTGPVHKGIMNDAGFDFTGHTEFIAVRCGAKPVMMLATPGLRVALATTHLPLANVSAAITPETLESVIRILNHDLRQRFAIAEPKILVCGLNPHAGENGHLGHEEIRVIQPVLESLRAEGIHLQGPLAADTLFTPKYMQQADVILAMYHDQGLPVLKYLGFGHAVNITLGLPIVRTSVDHGTALELAGTGQADPGSLLFAIETALAMIPHQHSPAL